MKRNYTLLFSCSLLLLVVAGCQKERATSLQEGELRSAPLPGQPTYCRIESIWKNRFAIEEAFHLILYDEFENPIAITTPGIGTGRPWVTFIYDRWHRLREYRGEYIGGAFEFLHRYGFDKNGRIGIDTFYAFGQPIENPTHYLNRSISKIEYDNQNRVIKEVADFEFGGLHLETNYNYDAAGWGPALELLASGRLPLDALIDGNDVRLDGLLPAMERLAAGEIPAKVMVVPQTTEGDHR